LRELEKLDKKSEFFGLSPTDLDTQKLHQIELKRPVREDEIKWMQRAKEIQLRDGDSNSKFFHQKANGRRRKNLIVRLNQDEGVMEG
jgi:hypothetical protein